MTNAVDHEEITGEAVKVAAPLATRHDAPIERPRERGAQIAQPVSMSRVVQSADISEIAGALVAAQLDFGDITRTRETLTGPLAGYKYCNLADVAEAVRPALAAQGIIAMQIPSGNVLVTRLLHKSGQWIEASIQIVQPQEGRGGIQALGSALTYLRRYSLTSMLGLAPGDEDDDGGAAQHANRPPSNDGKRGTFTRPGSSPEGDGR